jgi:hypothetical protein
MGRRGGYTVLVEDRTPLHRSRLDSRTYMTVYFYNDAACQQHEISRAHIEAYSDGRSVYT